MKRGDCQRRKERERERTCNKVSEIWGVTSRRLADHDSCKKRRAGGLNQGTGGRNGKTRGKRKLP